MALFLGSCVDSVNMIETILNFFVALSGVVVTGIGVTITLIGLKVMTVGIGWLI